MLCLFQGQHHSRLFNPAGERGKAERKWESERVLAHLPSPQAAASTVFLQRPFHQGAEGTLPEKSFPHYR